MSEMTESILDKIKTLEETRVHATVNADVQVLKDLFSEDLVWIHATGGIDSKETWLEKVASGRVKYTEMQTDESSYRVFGDTVVVTGQGRTSFIAKIGTRSMKMSFTTVYHRFNDSWKNITMQVTRID
jgi:ketosteroid isomerase-like protein